MNYEKTNPWIISWLVQNQVLAGVVAGSGKIMVYPLSVIKTRGQLKTANWQELAQDWKKHEQGRWQTAYKGITLSGSKTIVAESIRMPLYEFWRRELPLPEHAWYRASLCGTMASGVSMFVSYPLDVWNTRYSGHANRDTMIKVGRQLNKERAWFRGIGSNELKGAPFNLMFFGLYDHWWKPWRLSTNHGFGDWWNRWHVSDALVAGFAAGATVPLNHPFDTVVRRLQAAREVPGRSYYTFYHMFGDLYKTTYINTKGIDLYPLATHRPVSTLPSQRISGDVLATPDNRVWMRLVRLGRMLYGGVVSNIIKCSVNYAWRFGLYHNASTQLHHYFGVPIKDHSNKHK